LRKQNPENLKCQLGVDHYEMKGTSIYCKSTHLHVERTGVEKLLLMGIGFISDKRKMEKGEVDWESALVGIMG
jgi:hypothetical protein